jgi:hypothetical protein
MRSRGQRGKRLILVGLRRVYSGAGELLTPFWVNPNAWNRNRRVQVYRRASAHPGEKQNMKHLKLSFQLAILAAVFASVSMADVVPFQWSTTGTFSAPGLPAGLTFTGAALSAVTNTDASGNLLGIDLGHFTFDNIVTDYTGTFTLNIVFVRPDSSDDPTVLATLVADANVSGINDQLTITFPSASTYHFDGADGTGTFDLAVNDVSDRRTGSHTDTVPVLGDIRGADLTPSAVPEPGSVLLLCTVLGGIAVLGRRKLVSR